VCQRNAACKAEYGRRRHAENPARAVEAVRQWRARPGNSDRERENARKSRLADPERERERRRQYSKNREQRRKDKHRYAAENRERVPEDERRRRMENWEQGQEYRRQAARASTRERLLEDLRQTRARHPERHRETNRRYFQREDRPCANRDAECSSEFAIRGSVYCRTHKKADDAARHERKRRGALRRHAEVQGWICTWCSLRLPEDLGDMHLDHVIPKAVLVIEDDWNLQALHRKCNLEKGGRLTTQAIALAADHGIELGKPPAGSTSRHAGSSGYRADTVWMRNDGTADDPSTEGHPMT
jgi:hypothetical protein